MPHILKNNDLEIHLDLPLEGYSFSRFDWTGKITEVRYKGILVSVVERTDNSPTNLFGKGFYNEFGILTALGYNETEVGGWFHKIGVGLLKKPNKTPYDFSKNYRVNPAHFTLISLPEKLIIHCTGQEKNGYAYRLKKEISLTENGFAVSYELQNTGEKFIETDEYNHNFIAIGDELMSDNYRLKLPFELFPEKFDEIINEENKVIMNGNEISFQETPNEQFFFSDLTGGKRVEATWALENLNQKIGLSETGNFETDKINLWGWRHVISPELFIKIQLEPGHNRNWSRNYKIYSLD